MNASSEIRGSANYYEILQGVIDILPGRLPPGLHHIKPKLQSGRNFVVFRFPEFKNSQFELHFSKHSKNHTRYFREGPVDVVAFYYGNNVGGRDLRIAWLNEIQTFLNLIEKQIGGHVVSGEWGEEGEEEWVWMATKIGNGEASQYDLERLSAYVSHFILATYIPISRAFVMTM
jgi:hypothetical protein